MERFLSRLFILAGCLMVGYSGSAESANVQYLWDKTVNIKGLLQFNIINNTLRTNDPIPAKAQLFTLKNNLKSSHYEYRLRSAFIDIEQVTHARYDEFYKNIPVLWADTIVHHKKSQSINGTFVTGIEKDLPSIHPRLTDEQAISIAKNNFERNSSVKIKTSSRFIKSELVIYPYAKDSQGMDVAHLAYYISYYTSGNNKLSNPTYVIDANSGEVLIYFDNLKRLEQAVGTGPGGYANSNLTVKLYHYGMGAEPLLGFLLIQTDTPQAGQCTWANHGVGMINLNNATIDPSIFPILQNDEINYPLWVVNPCNAPNYANPGDAVNHAHSPLDDVLFYGTQTNRLFSQYSIKNPSSPLGTTNPAIRYYIHIASNDAFALNAGCSNTPDACHNQQIVLGNGSAETTYPQVGYDVVGHETAHIYVGLTSGLVYANQSGGMNEAFADITGAALGAYLGQSYSWFPPISNRPPLDNPLGISFWTQGALDSIASPALRYLYNPPLDGASIDNAANYTPGMGVHNSSGVYNKAFYNMAISFGQGAMINYSAILQAYRFIVVANDMYWTSNSDFMNGSCGVMLSSKNPAYGGNNAYFNATKQAFANVGVHCMRSLSKLSVTE